MHVTKNYSGSSTLHPDPSTNPPLPPPVHVVEAVLCSLVAAGMVVVVAVAVVRRWHLGRQGEGGVADHLDLVSNIHTQPPPLEVCAPLVIRMLDVVVNHF